MGTKPRGSPSCRPCRVLALRPEFQFRLGVAYTDAFASVAICMLK